jgi:hemoglobin
MSEGTLYQRLGGYDAIAAVANDLLPRLIGDALLGRFWQHRAADSIAREKQLPLDFLCSASGGPMYYTGRDMKLSHKGMQISEADWQAFLGHQKATLEAFALPAFRATRRDRICREHQAGHRRSLSAETQNSAQGRSHATDPSFDRGDSDGWQVWARIRLAVKALQASEKG